MRTRRLLLLVSLGTVTAFAACTLNPQPLPPLDPNANATAEDVDGGSSFGGSDASRTDPNAPQNDAGLTTPPPNDEGGADAGDAGDAGDASDASDGAT